MGLLDKLKALFGADTPDGGDSPKKPDPTPQSQPKPESKPELIRKPEPKPTPTPSSENQPSTADRLMLEFLEEQGYIHKVLEDGDIQFKYQKLTFLYMSSNKDDLYFHLALPCVHEFEEDQRSVIIEATNKLNNDMKVAKYIVTDDDVWITAESLLDSTPKLEDFVPRFIDLLYNARKELYRELE